MKRKRTKAEKAALSRKLSLALKKKWRERKAKKGPGRPKKNWANVQTTNKLVQTYKCPHCGKEVELP